MGKRRSGRVRIARLGVVLGGLASLVLPGVGPGRAPAVAVDGEVPIVFGSSTSTDRRENGIGLVNADGSGRRIVVAPPVEHDYVSPDLSPDGRRIAFLDCDTKHFRYPDFCVVVITGVEGSDLRRLNGHRSPRWSPDGMQIAAVRYEPNTFAAHVSVMPADGSTFRDLAGTSGADVDWSPDGKTLVFSTAELSPDSAPAPALLYTVPVDGSHAPRLLGAGISGEHPSWSPDGTQIAFKRLVEYEAVAVSVVNADGSGVRDVVRKAEHSFGRPGWSPDSSRIAVATYVTGPDGRLRTPVSTYDLVTGAVAKVMDIGGGSLSWANPAGPTPCRSGYWLAGEDGGVFSFGTAGFFGSAKTARPRRPVVGMAASPSGRSYWLVASDGGVFSFGDAGFFGSTGGLSLARPMVGMAATPSGRGYWLVASDGGVFAFGDAGFFGSTGGLSLNNPVVGMGVSPSGRGYWLVASDGGVFAFGDAGFFGSTGGMGLNQPVIGLGASPSGGGYWLVAADGGIFTYGDAPQVGSAASPGLPAAIVGASSAAGRPALLIAAADGAVVPFGHARSCGSMYRQRLGSPVVGVALSGE